MTLPLQRDHARSANRARRKVTLCCMHPPCRTHTPYPPRALSRFNFKHASSLTLSRLGAGPQPARSCDQRKKAAGGVGSSERQILGRYHQALQMAALWQRAFGIGCSISPIRNLKRRPFSAISRTTVAVVNEVWSDETRRGIFFVLFCFVLGCGHVHIRVYPVTKYLRTTNRI